MNEASDEAMAFTERWTLDRELGCELARKIAIKPYNHGLVADIAEQIEGDPSGHPARFCS